MNAFPRKTTNDLSCLDFFRLVRTSKERSPQVRVAYDAMRCTWQSEGTPTWQNEVYDGGMRMAYRTPVFCLTRDSAERLAGKLGLEIGGYRPKGDLLFRSDVSDRLRTTTKNAAFVAAWAEVAKAARGGGSEAIIAGRVVRVAVASSGTRSAPAIHPDDLEAFAESIDHRLHVFSEWSPEWLGRTEVAAAAGTYLGDEFLKVWKALDEAHSKALGDIVIHEGVPLRLERLKKKGVVTLFMHRSSLEAFASAGFFPKETLPPKTSEWRGLTEFARELGVAPSNSIYVELVDRLTSASLAGETPFLDGRPVLFGKRATVIARAWCFHRSEAERVRDYLVRRREAGRMALVARKDETSGRSLPIADPYGDNPVSRLVFRECRRQWGRNGGLASFRGIDMHGLKDGADWRLEVQSAASFCDLVRKLERERDQGDRLARTEVFHALDVEADRFAFAWSNMVEAAANDRVSEVGIRPIVVRRASAPYLVAMIERSDLPVLARFLSARVRDVISSPEGYVRAADVLRVFGDDEVVRLTLDELRRLHDAGRETVREGRLLRCGYEVTGSRPFVVAADDLPLLEEWIGSVRDRKELLGGVDVVEIEDVDELFRD